VIVGIDPGSKRVGVAIADPRTLFARPYEVIDLDEVEPVERIAEIVVETGASKLVVGRPTSLSGRAGPAVTAQAELVARLKERVGIPVEEFDERLTTVVAERGLRAGGGRAQARRALKDAIAAQVMLQGYLDRSR
jgi:putative holliday junction resolvase